jgi:hypothetical protein
MALTIVKASGETEDFRIQKLIDSLMRSGVPPDVASDIAGQVERQISPRTHTNHIFRLAKRLLKRYNAASCMRYSLKGAISALGPSGYPFEQYFARVLSAYGYRVELNKFVEGYCVRHEVDIIAKKDEERFVIECKYHSEGGKSTDVKTALYVHARFADIKKAEDLRSPPASVRQGWLVTNTRCTSEAIAYAECMGLRIVSWRYPEEESLARMIENKRLYPVTVLPSAKKRVLETLLSRNLILAGDIAGMDPGVFIARSGLEGDIASALKNEADRLCAGPQP